MASSITSPSQSQSANTTAEDINDHHVYCPFSTYIVHQAEQEPACSRKKLLVLDQPQTETPNLTNIVMAMMIMMTTVTMTGSQQKIRSSSTSLFSLLLFSSLALLLLSPTLTSATSHSATADLCVDSPSSSSEEPSCSAAKKETIMSGDAERERTFIMIKPDGVHRGLVGEIIKRFEQKGFKLVAMKFMWANESLLKQHYADLSARPFFPGLVKYMSSGPVCPMVWEGTNVVKTGRVMLGETNPAASLPGTIRGDFCIEVGRNICHGSDSVESAKKEIALWFKPEELVKWKSVEDPWLYE